MPLIDTSLMFREHTPPPFKASKDVFGTEKVLVYGNQSIFAQNSKEFTNLTQLERRQREADNNDPLYDNLQDEIDEKAAELKYKINVDLTRFLNTHLGSERDDLVPIILDRFSQKAFTTLISAVNEHTTKEKKGFYTDEASSLKHCTLHISPEEGPVQIEATMDVTYTSFIPQATMEKVPRPTRIKGAAIYTIGLDGTMKTNVQFSIRDCR